MQINLSTSYTALSSLLDVSEATKFKIQVISGRVLATESAAEPEQYSSEGYQFGSLEMFTSTASFGTLYVRATSPDTRVEVTIADTGFNEGVSPFTGATGSTGGGGGGSEETPASIKQKYESNPNTNALTDDLKEKIENGGEGVTPEQLQEAIDTANNYTNDSINLLPPSITPDAAQAKADTAEANAILYSESKRATGIDHTLDGHELTLKITNSLGDIDDTTFTLPSGGGGGGTVDSVDVDYSNDTKKLTVSVNGVEGESSIDLKEQPRITLDELDSAPNFPDQADPDGLNIAIVFLSMEFRGSRQFTLDVPIDEGDDFHGFVPSSTGGVLTYTSISHENLSLADWTYIDKEGFAWIATLQSGRFKHFKSLTGGTGVSVVDVSYDANTKALTVDVDGVSDAQVLDFVDAATLAETQQASLELSKSYTREQIAEIPTGGEFGVTDIPIGTVTTFSYEPNDNTYLKCDGSTVDAADYPLLYQAVGHTFSDVARPENKFDLPSIPDEIVAESIATIDIDKQALEIAAIESMRQDSAIIGTTTEIVVASANTDTVDLNFIDTHNFVPYNSPLQAQEEDPFLYFAVATSIESTEEVFHVIGVSLSMSKVRQWAFYGGEVLSQQDLSLEGLVGERCQLEMHQESGFNSASYTLIAATESKILTYKLELSINGTSTSVKQSELDIDSLLSLSVTQKYPRTGAVYAVVSKSDYGSCVYQIQNHALIKKQDIGLQILGIDPIRYDPDSYRAVTQSVFVDLIEGDDGLIVRDGGAMIESAARQSNMSFVNLKDTSKAIKLAYGADGILHGSTYEDIQVERYQVRSLAYIKAKPDHTQSSIVESVEAEVDEGELTVSVNGVSATTQLPDPTLIAETTMPVVTLEDVGNPEFPEDKEAIAATFAGLSYKNSFQFRLKIYLSNNYDMNGFLPTAKGGVLFFDKYQRGDDQLQECFWRYTDREGDAYQAYMHGANFTDFKRITQDADGSAAKIEVLESKIEAQELQITELLETVNDIKGAAYSGFALYSAEVNELEVCMRHIDPSVDDDKSTIVLDGQSPSPDEPGGEGLHTVYHGWTSSNLNELLDDEIRDVLPEERSETQHIYGDNYTPPPNSDYKKITEATYTGNRTVAGIQDAKFMYICYPAQIVSPEISTVMSGGQAVAWRSTDIIIDDKPYVLRMTDEQNAAPQYSLQLSNGGY